MSLRLYIMVVYYKRVFSGGHNLGYRLITASSMQQGRAFGSGLNFSELQSSTATSQTSLKIAALRIESIKQLPHFV
ncbi:hypothetical protein WN943_015527 [Citrus x changshan-huyou]